MKYTVRKFLSYVGGIKKKIGFLKSALNTKTNRHQTVTDQCNESS